jgi:hypothetical protein
MDTADVLAISLRPARRARVLRELFLAYNDRDRALAFWIRYTAFVPKGTPEAAVGELWAIVFDAEGKRTVAVHQQHPMAACEVSRDVSKWASRKRIWDHDLSGAAEQGGHRIAWSLEYQGESDTLLLLPQRLYEGGIPKAKSLVATPIYTPFLTLFVLRIGDREHAVRGILRALRAKGRFAHFEWHFESDRLDDDEADEEGLAVTARFTASRESFVRLLYVSPPGGHKTCWNTKLARCELTLSRRGEQPLHLVSRQRAAFEILEEERDSE